MQPSQENELPSMMGFWLVFIGQAFSLFGSRLVQFTLVWWLTSEAESASVLAFASIMAILPQVILGPFAGTLVDRWNRRRVMVIADTVIACVILILITLFAMGRIQIWHIYIAMFIRSLGGAFHWPAMQATTTLMIHEEHYTRVAGLNQSLQGLANIVAPPLGAVLLAFLPVEMILSIDVMTAIIAIVPLFIVFIPQPVVKDSLVSVRSVISDLREGMRYLWNWKGLRYILMMSMIINFLVNPAFTLLPLIVVKHFQGGAIELAWFQSANGLGMILGGLALGVWGGFKKRIVTAMIAVALSGVAVTIFGYLPGNFLLVAVICVFFFAFFNSMANGTFFAALQAIVPPEMQGRVFTLIMSMSVGMSPIGYAIAGPIAEIFGERIWFNIGGIAFVVMGIGAFFIPTVMNIESEVKTSDILS
jgi:DHA3 family macrolide efflux protein-like MFS transporter